MNFFFCDCGERVSNEFDKINNEIWQNDWYTYPIAVQRMLPIVIAGSQQKVAVHGFGNLALTRESFKTVNCADDF